MGSEMCIRDSYKYLTENGYLERAMSNSEKLCQLCKESPEDLKAYSEIHKVIKLLNGEL